VSLFLVPVSDVTSARVHFCDVIYQVLKQEFAVAVTSWRFVCYVWEGETGNFYPHHHVQTGSGTHPASYQMGTRDSSSGGKEAVAWSCTSTPPICLHGVVLS